MAILLPELIFQTAQRVPDSDALVFQNQSLTYAELANGVDATSQALLNLGLAPAERVAIFLDKRIETVLSLFGAAHAGGVFVPINPQLKGEQVAYIMADCNVRVLVTSSQRFAGLTDALKQCHDLRTVVLIDYNADKPVPPLAGVQIVGWQQAHSVTDQKIPPHRRIDADMAAILYTSGSTGKPKGVVLSHRNIMVGAESVSSYLKNNQSDRILSVLPLSFDYGMSQLTTAFFVGASVVLLNYLLPQDVIKAVAKHRITGLAAVPPLWIQLAQLEWPESIREHLRYITNSGGAMPRATLDMLRGKLPKTEPYLMYGLTEAFRSTYLPPDQVDARPDSMGKAIPNAEIVVVREDGELCAAGEPGELVHRGALVSLGYWNDEARTAERFKPSPGQPREIPLTELAVWSGDTVRMDEEGYLYFVSRRDEMIKTSGYRVSPTEIEEVVYATGLAGEAAAFGVTHPTLGQAIAVVCAPSAGQERVDTDALMIECKKRLPTFMVPTLIVQRPALPRNPNGKIDRKLLSTELKDTYVEGSV